MAPNVPSTMMSTGRMSKPTSPARGPRLTLGDAQRRASASDSRGLKPFAAVEVMEARQPVVTMGHAFGRATNECRALVVARPKHGRSFP
jgi:hypothetical protein